MPTSFLIARLIGYNNQVAMNSQIIICRSMANGNSIGLRIQIIDQRISSKTTLLCRVGMTSTYQGNWERQGYGLPIYVNETYEFDDKLFQFKKNPPLVPYAQNEVGSYRRTFKIPST